jgi:Polyketide cyclase / dehydrase and lipid transport
VAQVTAHATRTIAAPPERVLELLLDYREARPKILTDGYTAYRVEQGGKGAGTVFSYHFAAGGRERDYRMQAEETDGGLTERDQLSTFVNTWTIVPTATGSAVTLEGSWQGAGGIGGFFEGIFAPLGLRRIYSEILDKLAAALQDG